MKIIAIIINLFFPGVGTMIVGQVGKGIIQLILSIIAAFMIATGLLSVIGIPLGIGVWIWALVSVASSKAENTVIIREVVREVHPEQKSESGKQ